MVYEAASPQWNFTRERHMFTRRYRKMNDTGEAGHLRFYLLFSPQNLNVYIRKECGTLYNEGARGCLL